MPIRTYTAYRAAMPTQHRSVRVDDERWRLLGEQAAAQGTTRGDVIQQFVAWYLRERGARLPERPSAASK